MDNRQYCKSKSELCKTGIGGSMESQCGGMGITKWCRSKWQEPEEKNDLLYHLQHLSGEATKMF